MPRFILPTVFLLLLCAPANIVLAGNPLGGGDVLVASATPTPIYGVRNATCGDPAPTLAYGIANLTTAPVNGTCSDGGTGSRFSAACGGVVPVRLMSYTSTDGFLGTDFAQFFGDAINITVEEASSNSTASTAVTIQSNLSVGVAQTAGLIGGRITRFIGRDGTQSFGNRASQVLQVSAVNPTQGMFAFNNSDVHEDSADSSLSLGRSPAHQNGLAAGDGDTPFGAWANLIWSGFGDSTAAAQSDGYSVSGVVGIDKFQDNLLFGAGLSFEWSQTDTSFNNGNVEQLGFGIVPYAAYRLNDWLDASGALGYTHLSGDATRRLPGAGQTPDQRPTGTEISGDYTGHRFFATANLNARNSYDEFSIGYGTGLLWAQQWIGAYDEDGGTRAGSAQAQLGRLLFNVQPSYLFDLSSMGVEGYFIEPYFRADYSYDWSLEKINTVAGQAEHPNDRNRLMLGFGADLYTDDDVSFNLEAQHEFVRQSQRETAVSVTGRIAF